MMTKSNNITLERTLNNKVRYYKLSLFLNLFNEYILEKKYGSTKNKKPTGIKIEYYLTINDAISAYSKKLQEKLNKGYKRRALWNH